MNANDDVQGIELRLDRDAMVSVTQYPAYVHVTLGAIKHVLRPEQARDLLEKLIDAMPDVARELTEVAA